MSIFKDTDFTFDREQIKSISEALLETGFSNPALTELHSLMTGIVAKKQLPILGRLEGLIGKGSGGCNPTASDNQFGGTDKTWNPVTISDRLTQCYKDLENTFWAYGLKNGINRADLTATDLANYILEITSEAVLECVFRFAWFGDVDIDNVSNSGILVNGTDKAYFDKLDGFFKQIAEIITADSTKLTAGLATKNGQATFALQAFNTTDTTNMVVSNTLDNMIYGADLRLRDREDSIFVVTQSVKDQYERELKKATISYTTERLENGISVLKCGSITVYAFNLWDRIIRNYLQDGTKAYNPHRAVLLVPTNMMVGTEDETALTELDIFYDKTTKETHIDFEFLMDAKIGIDYLIQAAY